METFAICRRSVFVSLRGQRVRSTPTADRNHVRGRKALRLQRQSGLGHAVQVRGAGEIQSGCAIRSRDELNERPDDDVHAGLSRFDNFCVACSRSAVSE